MSPDQSQTAEKECAGLLKSNLIEVSNSQWACEAFYVNKRSEQVRGQMRLVVNYQPLNHFLQDDKFPLPNRNILFAKLKDANWFSKFDLKSGFWQLGIHPDDRAKTGFCIPNHHFQWRVMPFGLKTAPSLFQKAMIKIFQPILHTALVYIDDILLFSSTLEEHMQLLYQFAEIVKKYGVMLSEKKMISAKQQISFLGTEFANGQYSPGTHISEALEKFPDHSLTFKQIQQFLGIINYVREFIPQSASLIHPLTKMLKKKAPPWGTSQTTAIQQLKEIAKKLPSLSVPIDGKRILQTDASDKFWGAVLLIESQGTRRICGFASGRFKLSEQHYHSTFKEILAVKYAIKKFNFHLIGYHFLIEMGMSAFPKTLQFKQKTIPNPQLLRWASWFSQYTFEVKHIKGFNNILADFFSRNCKDPPEVNMFSSLSPSTSRCSEIPRIPPDFLSLSYPWENEILAFKRTQYELELFSDYGGSILNPFGVHPEYPFCQIFSMSPTDFPLPLLWFFWYLCHKYHILIEFQCSKFQQLRRDNLKTFLSWFQPLSYWTHMFSTNKGFLVFQFYRPLHLMESKVQSIPFSNVCGRYQVSIHSLDDQYSEAQRFLFQENQVIPQEI